MLSITTKREEPSRRWRRILPVVCSSRAPIVVPACTSLALVLENARCFRFSENIGFLAYFWNPFPSEILPQLRSHGCCCVIALAFGYSLLKCLPSQRSCCWLMIASVFTFAF